MLETSRRNFVMSNLIQTATRAGSFTTLLKAADAAGLTATLSGKGPFTVFAPNDDAFAKLPAGTLEALIADKKKLTAVLTYHVIAGKVFSKDIRGSMSVATVEGEPLSIDLKDGVLINDAHVLTADIAADNGVIHVISCVLMPPSMTAKAA